MCRKLNALVAKRTYVLTRLVSRNLDVWFSKLRLRNENTLALLSLSLPNHQSLQRCQIANKMLRREGRGKLDMHKYECKLEIEVLISNFIIFIELIFI